MTIYSPATQQELVHMLALAIQRGEPAAVRYPRGSLMQAVSSVPVEKGRWEVLAPLKEQTVVATGAMVAVAQAAARKHGAGLVNARTIKPLDEELLKAMRAQCRRVIVMEESVDCLGRMVTEALAPIEVVRMNVPTEPTAHACVGRQRDCCGLNEKTLGKILAAGK